MLAWLRWFSSGPHIVGALSALICVLAAQVGAVETVLRDRFDTWWWVLVLSSYLAGWVVTAAALRTGAAQPWRHACLPPADGGSLRWLAREWPRLRRRVLLAVAGVASVGGTAWLFAALSVAGLEKVNVWVGMLAVTVGAVSSLVSALVSWRQSRTRRSPGDEAPPTAELP